MKKLFSFLGTNEYVPCFYEYDGVKASLSRFVVTAIYEILSKSGTQIDEVIILMTDEAEKKNWYDSTNHKGEQLKGLYNTWQELFPNEASKLKTVKIKSEQEESDQWDLFDTIYDLIDEGDEIYFDITHGFRSLPLMALLILNYTRLTKKAKIGRIVYGNFEKLGPAFKVKEMPEEERIAPIIDLTSMVSLFDWTNGVDSFLRTGNPIIIQELAEEAVKQDNQSDELKELRKLADRLYAVSMSIETCRGKTIDKEIKITKEHIQKVKERETQKLKPFGKLIHHIDQKFENFQAEPILNSISIVEWCIEHHLYQQGYTFLQESIVTAICELAQLEKDNEETRALVNSSIKILNDQLPENKWKVKEKDKPIVKHLLDVIKPYEEYLKEYQKLTDYRNNLNHSEMNKNRIKYKNIANELESLLKGMSPFLDRINSDIAREN